MAVRSVVCVLTIFILVSFTAGKILLTPNTLEYGIAEANNGVNMTIYQIHLNSSATSYQIQFIRATPVDNDYAAEVNTIFNRNY